MLIYQMNTCTMGNVIHKEMLPFIDYHLHFYLIINIFKSIAVRFYTHQSKYAITPARWYQRRKDQGSQVEMWKQEHQVLEGRSNAEILCTNSQIILWTKLISYEIARIVPQGADVIHSETYNIRVFECNYPVAATQGA